jgi:hypothetical protein
VAGKGQLDLGSMDADPSGGAILDKDGLAEAQLRSNTLPLWFWHLLALEEDAQPVTALAVLADEDAEDMQSGHLGDLRSIRPGGVRRSTVLRVGSPTRGVDVSEDGLKQRLAHRAQVLLVALSIGIAGVAWAGCGGGSDSTNEAQERIEKGAEEAKQGLEKGKEEVRKGFEKAEQEAKQGVTNGSEQAQKAIEKGKAEAQKGLEEGKERAQRAIEEAENYGGGN